VTNMETTETRPPVPVALSRLGDSWGILATYGVITIGLGLVLVIWPKDTLVVLAVFLAIQLLVNGIFQIVSAFAASAADGGVRALVGLSGALSFIVGLLCLREPLQTVTVIGMLIGAWWAISGIIEIFTALLGSSQHKVWRILMGVVSVIAGGYLLVNPKVSLGALVIIASVWLFAYGAMAVIAGLRLRSFRSAGPEAQALAAP
jgi:uncharacterized membrane protein HdeD (DUF308 family)